MKKFTTTQLLVALCLVVVAVGAIVSHTTSRTPENVGEPGIQRQGSDAFEMPSDDALRDELTTLQYRVTQRDWTEPPFANEYDKLYEPGIYVDIVSGEPLYSSVDKYDSGTGWPSFVKPITSNAVSEHEDTVLGTVRTEIRSVIADSHLGHVFDDGPAERGGLRYCMNSAAMRFVPLDQMEELGYTEWIESVRGSVKISDNGFPLISDAFDTDITQSTIQLDQVLNGGPGKDGIPALNNPLFAGVDDPVHDYLGDEAEGILIAHDGQRKLYPFAILNWHEIVNDTIGGEALPIVVTFCPLCGSSIVYKRGQDEFGVSGLLYNSNMLMYDQATESLWSQSQGRALVGERVGEELELLGLSVVAWDVLRNDASYDDVQVLSPGLESEWSRAYDRTPYAGYAESDSFYFPVEGSVNSEDLKGSAALPYGGLSPKTLMYIVPYKGMSYAVERGALDDGQRVNSEDGFVGFTKRDGRLVAADREGNELPGYVEMVFSWEASWNDEMRVIVK